MLDRILLLEANIKNLEQLRIQMEHEPGLFNKKVNEWALRYGFLESIQIVIDISCHIVSHYHLGNPNKYSECIELLVQYKYISNELGSKIVSMIKLRNLLSHEYTKIDKDKLQSYLYYLDDFTSFIQQIQKYL